MKKIIITLALAAMTAVCANAQIIVSAGYQHNSNVETIGSTTTTEPSDGFYVEGTYNYSIANGLGVMFGIGAEYASETSSGDYGVLSGSLKYTTLELYVPVVLNYKYDISNNFAVGAMAGPSFGYTMMDQVKGSSSLSSSSSIVNLLDNDNFNRFGIYADEGIFVEYAGKYRLTFVAFEQLNNATKASNVTEKNNGFRIGVSYIF